MAEKEKPEKAVSTQPQAQPQEEKKGSQKKEKVVSKPVGRAMPTGARRIVRLMQTDVNGDLSVERALREIKGVSFMFSRAVCMSTGVDGKRKVAELNEGEMKSLENFIKNPQLTSWMLNRRKDMETGRDRHLTMNDLDFSKREDINMLRRMRAYKGVRHELGQPVRGQRTRSSFRSQKSVGVSKKKAQAAPKPAAASAGAAGGAKK